MEKNKRKRKFIATALQKRILILVLAAAIIPATIVAFCLYYLIFSLLAWQIGIPETIAYNLLPVARKVNLIILVAVPVAVLIIWKAALELSNRISGPLYRLEKELDTRISGKEAGPIRIRKNDELASLADKINKLLSK